MLSLEEKNNLLWSFDLATGLIRWFYGYHYSGSSNSFVSYANSEFTIISPAASANDAGSLKCLPVVGSDWAVQAGTQQSHYFCPPREGPLETILQPEANHIPTERYINKFHPAGQKLWYTREFDILLVYACARDAIFGLPESGQFCAFD